MLALTRADVFFLVREIRQAAILLLLIAATRQVKTVSERTKRNKSQRPRLIAAAPELLEAL
jgi:hypothetical protein